MTHCSQNLAVLKLKVILQHLQNLAQSDFDLVYASNEFLALEVSLKLSRLGG